jgi:hypothetical protein
VETFTTRRVLVFHHHTHDVLRVKTNINSITGRNIVLKSYMQIVIGGVRSVCLSEYVHAKSLVWFVKTYWTKSTRMHYVLCRNNNEQTFSFNNILESVHIIFWATEQTLRPKFRNERMENYVQIRSLRFSGCEMIQATF